MENDGAGWKLFAGIMIIIGGTFNIIDGLVGITNVRAVEALLGGQQLPLTNNIKTYSWVVLIAGLVMLLAGFLIFSGNMFGRVVGVIAASGNAILQLAYLQHNTFWSLTMIIVDFLVIWALVAHGGRLIDEPV
ncbi:MAG: hypothetical protein ACHQIG_04425 [Acidimicrobiia bacterium]